tara:strand:+ start:172 stop:780 length:609 start_codon:yes stop_codon:yes gene_type:complete
MITTIVFDIGGVLLDIHPDRTFQYLSDATDINKNVIANSFPWELHDEYEKGNLSNTEWFWSFRDALPQPCCLKETDFWKAWSLLLGEEKETVNILNVLSEEYTIWLLSNTNPKHIQDEIEKKYLFPNLVNGTIYSYDVGCRKPERKIYDVLLKNSKSKPDECVFIDDLIENVHAAQSLGIQGIHYKDKDNLIMDLRRIGIMI